MVGQILSRSPYLQNYGLSALFLQHNSPQNRVPTPGSDDMLPGMGGSYLLRQMSSTLETHKC